MLTRYRISLIASVIFLLNSCDNNKSTKEKAVTEHENQVQSVVEYSPYMPNKEQRWMGKEEAQNAERLHNIIEVSEFVGVEPTAEQKQASENLYQATLKNAIEKGWFSFEKAKADGFIHDPFNDFNHYINYDFLLDNKQLDPESPEYLMFYQTEQGQLLAGVMFLQDGFVANGKQIGGGDTTWHYHYFNQAICAPTLAPEELTSGAEKCEGGFILQRSPEMMHVWFIDHPKGRFATSMSIDDKLISENILIKEQTEAALSKSL